MPISPFIVKALRHSCVLLLICSQCFGQTSRVNELLAKLKQSMPDTTRLRLMRDLGAAYSPVDPVKKFYYANEFKKLAEKINDPASVSEAYIQMGISYGIRSRLDSAMYYFTLGYNTAEKYKYQLGVGRSLANIGYVYDRLDDKNESVRHYFKALEIYRKINYQRGISQLTTNIGSIYSDLKQHRIAESYYKQSLKIYTETKDEAGRADAMYSIGNCRMELGDLAHALDYFNQSLAIRQRTGDINGTALVKMSLGAVYAQQKRFSQSLQVLNEALTAVRGLEDKFEECEALVRLSQVYLDMHRYQDALKQSELALSIAKAIRSKVTMSKALKHLIAASRSLNQTEKAFDYQAEYIATQDSILSEKAIKDVTLTEFGRIRTENAVLAKDNKIIASKNTHYLAKINNYGYVIAVTATALLLVSVLLIKLYRRNVEKQATNKLLLNQKEEIAVINRELEALNKELNSQMQLIANQNGELGRLNDVKNKFFSIVSHDLRSPLSTLQTLFGIYRQGDLGDKELGMLLRRLEDTILSTSAFLDNLLEWSKNQFDGIIVNAAPFDISAIVNQNMQLFEASINLKGVKVINLALQPVQVFADKNMISLVIRNLLSNSIKFCRAGDEIIVNAEYKGDRVIVTIKDTGPGISKAEQERLFNLEHALSTGTHGEKGNHLGLILCRDMVVQNKGTISFSSEEGHGATFWVDLPSHA